MEEIIEVSGQVAGMIPPSNHSSKTDSFPTPEAFDADAPQNVSTLETHRIESSQAGEDSESRNQIEAIEGGLR